ncbi:hypothetical protein C8R46DRAFT_1362733 [Mycena filopes]|nr:hypothetical protein C8R46DRAFT_1362733 [Mycena filopes]
MSSESNPSALRARLAELDTSIFELRPVQARLKALEDERGSIQSQLDAIAYPVLTLPVEITSEIFLCCLPKTSGYSLHPTFKSPIEAPMLLLQICRTWRAIAISSPRLWAFLHLNLPDHSDKLLEIETYKGFLGDWLVRLGACPLSLTLDGFDVGAEEEAGRLVIPLTLNAIASHIQTLYLCIDPKDYPNHVVHFPALRRLVVGVPVAEDDDDPHIILENPIQAFFAAPQLRDIFIYGKVAAPSLFAIRWEQLTVFNGERISSRECATVLRCAPSLVECTFEEPHSAPDTPFVSHDGLKSLKIHEFGNVLFRFLAIPHLETLDLVLYTNDDEEDEDEDEAVSFISQTAQSLLEFKGPASHRVPVQCLIPMVSLTKLCLFFPQDDYLTEFFTLLNRANDPHFLPQLQSLQLNFSPAVAFEELVAALSSRAITQTCGARLQSFRQTLSWADRNFRLDPEGDVGVAVKQLREGGMEVYMGYPW